MLTVVSAQASGPVNRLSVAVAHLQAAIGQINNDVQGRMPMNASEPCADVHELQLIVCALADIIDALREQPTASACVA